MNHTLNPDLIAPCGMNCALCWAYQAQLYDLKKKGFNRKYCPGCIPRGEHCLHMRSACETVGRGLVRFCFECDQFPCDRLKRLDKRYRTKYHMSMTANLRQIRDQGMDAFLRDQESKWRCAKCGEHLVCCHCGLCLPCDLALLRQNRQYRWGEKELHIEYPQRPVPYKLEPYYRKENPMPYNMDLNRISLNDYRAILQKQNLLSSRRRLLDGLEEKFARLHSIGINTLAQLLSALSSSVKREAAANQSGVSADYLKVLKREAGTLKQKPVLLRNFPDMDESLIQSLFAKGIKTSKDYWESPDAGGTLYGLCDLVRINGVGPKAAKLFYDAGYRSAANIARANAETLFQQISAVNADHRYYQGTLGLKDVRFYIFFTRMLEAYCGKFS